jgi:hypothetical protein
MSTFTVAEPITAASLTTQELYRELLVRIGEDPTRDGLLDTPKRMEKSMAFLTRGYAMDVKTVLHDALFEVDYDEMVIVKDVEFFSMCEHHLLPFFGKAHIAAPDHRDRRRHRRRHPSARSRSHPRSPASLHDDARRGETALGNSDFGDAWGVQDAVADPQ